MEAVEATVTTASATELKLTANWPMVWLQAPGSTEIERQLAPGEVFERPAENTQRQELGGNRANWPHLKVGDRVVVRCYLVNERRSP